MVEPAVAQVVGGQGAVGPVLRFGAGAGTLVVSAVIEMPVALKLEAGWGWL